MQCGENDTFPLGLLLKAHDCSLIMRKTSGKSQLRGILQNTSILQTIKVTKTKGSLRSCHSREELEKAGRLNIVWDPRWDPGTEKGLQVKN